MADKIAVVTGSNKGIGYAIVKELCKREVGVVYLTSRDENKGLRAIQKLKQEGLTPQFHKLDVTDRNSVKQLADYLKMKHGGLDILINNAAILGENLYNTTYEDAENVLNVNYKSIVTIQELIFPILKDNARVINISSDLGHISNLKNTRWIERLTNPYMKLEDVNAFVDWYLDNVKNGTLKEEDFAQTIILSYRVSKMALCALTRVQQNSVGRGILINSLHPGFVQTDMADQCGELTRNAKTDLTLDEAGKVPAYLALDADQSLKGKYIWFDKSEKDWSDPDLKVHHNI